MSTVVTRRDLLRAAVGLGAVGLGAAACGVDLIPGHDAEQVSGSLSSSSMRGKVGWTIGYPRGSKPGDHLPVVISLHGRSGTHRSTFSTLHLGDTLTEVVKAGTPAFAIASVDGGDHGYWHHRADGTDAGAMVRRDLVPVLADHGLDTSRIGLYGWSMGGYGALLLAGRDRMPVRAVAVSSPALFTSAGGTAPGAFDDAADFDRNDVDAHPEWLHGVRLRVDCGLQDPFYAATRDFVARLHPRPAGGFTTGAHTDDYWRAVAPDQLRFLGARLA
ncbi:MAG: alpha/beta hydrolase [Marmoricola sp.]